MNRPRHRRSTLNLPEHGAFELLVGMVTVAAPIAFGFTAAAIVLCVVLGSVLMGMGMTLQAGRGPALEWHSSFDTVYLLLTALGALALALAGDRGAAAFLAVLVAVQAVLTFTTRYAAAA
jgi:hypothetical protein